MSILMIKKQEENISVFFLLSVLCPCKVSTGLSDKLVDLRALQLFVNLYICPLVHSLTI